jgi:hypothetical protein
VSVKLRFVRGLDFSSRVISWFSAGHLSHVDAVMPDGMLLGARSDVIQGIPTGVQVRPSRYEPVALEVVMDIPATAFQEAAFYGFLREQLGKPYDRSAIWAFAFNRDWHDTNAWICSELQAAALESAGILPKLFEEVNKITPVALADEVSAIRARIVTSG